MDGVEKGSIVVKLPMEVNGNTYLYQPSVSGQINNGRNFSIQGTVGIKGMKQLDLEISSDVFTVDPLSAKCKFAFLQV